MDKQSTNILRYLTPILLAIAVLMLLLIYFKKNSEQIGEVQNTTNTEQVPESTTAPIFNKDVKKQINKKKEVSKPSEVKQKTIDLPPSTQPNIKTVSRHAAIAMSYLNRRLSFNSANNTLSSCVSHMQKYEFTEAKKCLAPDFGALEMHAEWFRALLALATEGKSTSLEKIERIANNQSHIYRKQAAALSSTIK